MVILYTKNNCEKSKMAKKFLFENSIEFFEKNIDDNEVYKKDYSIELNKNKKDDVIPLLIYKNLIIHASSPVKMLSFKIFYDSYQKGK